MTRDTNITVITRLDRAIQYAAAAQLLSDVAGTLDPRFRGDGSTAGRSGSKDV
jgi:hypothetical protein